MSWYSGSQLTQRVRRSSSNTCSRRAAFTSRLAWLTATPFGAPVDPDVYCRNAIASALGDGRTHASASSSGTCDGSTCSSDAAHDVGSALPVARRPLGATRKRGAHERTIPPRRCRCLPRRTGTGTGIAPAQITAQKPTIASSVDGHGTMARSPRAPPRCSRAAIARARRNNVAQSIALAPDPVSASTV